MSLAKGKVIHVQTQYVMSNLLQGTGNDTKDASPTLRIPVLYKRLSMQLYSVLQSAG